MDYGVLFAKQEKINASCVIVTSVVKSEHGRKISKVKTLWYNLCMPYKNYNESMNNYMKTRWDKRRKEAVEHLGEKCVRCSAEDFLEFDHIDRHTKIMTVARASSRSAEFFWNEVNKCQLLCKPCHLEKTAEDFRKEFMGV